VIDIIIPVYRGLAATERCIRSVLASHVSEPHEIVVVDDATPEPALAAWLDEVASEGRVRLLRHAVNRGFVASVNEAMALHADRDVVLLNSDTEVAPGWLDRLAACARREDNAATVTPFTNNGSICSYPRFAAPNALPEGSDVRVLDALFAHANREVAVDLPVGVGFCMYVTRRALDAVGTFDEAAFGRGYGEEVDFCMRAAAAGLRNVLAADVFVFHEAEVSFGPGAAELRTAAQRIIDERYPEFPALVSEFISRDPLRTCRRRADLERLRASPLPRLLVVTHSWGGGIERHVQDLRRILEGACEFLVLRPDGAGHVMLEWTRAGEEFRAWFDKETAWDACVETLQAAGIDRVHYQHVHGHPEAVLDLADALALPYDVTLHDHLPLCRRYHLVDPQRRYCGGPGLSICDCPRDQTTQWDHLETPQWRARFHGWLRGAARVIVPSNDLATWIRHYFPDVELAVWTHPEVPAAVPRVCKVLLLGATSKIKGSDVLEACVLDARQRKLPLFFHLLGHLDRALPVFPEAPLRVLGSYPDAELARLIEIEKPDVFLFLSRFPETYSYTVGAAMATGKPIVAPRFGAFPERLARYAAAALYPLDASATQINDTVIAAAGGVPRTLRAVNAANP
jgi:GT2 family glycosyltransferase